MPYQGEHAARIHPVGRYVKFRRENDKFGKGIDVIWGVTKDGKAEVQSIRFDAKTFTPQQAKAWLKKHKYKAILFEEAKKVKKKAKQSDKQTASAALNLIGSANIQGAEEGKTERRFDLIAYTGGPLNQCFWSAPVIVDLDGIDAGNGIIPILQDHSAYSDRVIGQSEEAKVEDGKLVVRGCVYQGRQAADDVLDLADRGFEWQASIGATATQKDFIAEGNEVKVNGRTFPGPVYVSRKTLLREVSFVVIGADKSTSVMVASGVTNMDFEAYVKAQGFDAATLTASQRESFTRIHAMEKKAADKTDDDSSAYDSSPVETPSEKEKAKAAKAKAGETTDEAKKAAAAAELNLLASMRKVASQETGRVNRIRDLCAANPSIEIEVKGTKVNLQEHALLNGWTAKKVELNVLRASRPTASPHWYSPQSPVMNEAVIEAAVLQAGKCQLFNDSFFAHSAARGSGVPEDVKRSVTNELKARYPDQVMQAAHTLFKGGIGLQQVLCAGAQMNGKNLQHIRDDGDIEAVFRACNWNRDIRAEGASTASIANVLANVLNKFLLMGYLFVESTWREITAVRPVKDFKPTKSINLFGDFMYKAVGQDGQLQNATLQDQAFANQAGTYGRILTINRQMIINDDLSALTTTPMLMGRGAATKLNDVFWGVFLNPGNADDGLAFWSASHVNPNYFVGASANLQSSSLTTAVLTFDQQVDPTGLPLGLDAAILLYPPELETAAVELMNSEYIVYGGASAGKQPMNNVWKGRFKPVKSRYLSNSKYTGNSAVAWYLLAEPGMIPVIECCFLNGQENPTVQTAQAEFQTLGISIRGFFDFGVTAQNFRGGVKSKGAA